MIINNSTQTHSSSFSSGIRTNKVERSSFRTKAYELVLSSKAWEYLEKMLGKEEEKPVFFNTDVLTYHKDMSFTYKS